MVMHAAVTHGVMAHTGPGTHAAVHTAGAGAAMMAGTAMHAAGTRASVHTASAAAAAARGPAGSDVSPPRTRTGAGHVTAGARRGGD